MSRNLNHKTHTLPLVPRVPSIANSSSSSMSRTSRGNLSLVGDVPKSVRFNNIQIPQQRNITESDNNIDSSTAGLEQLTKRLLVVKETYLGNIGSSIFVTREQEGQFLFAMVVVIIFICIKSFAGTLSPIVLAGLLYLASNNFKGLHSKLGIGLGKVPEPEERQQIFDYDINGKKLIANQQKSTLEEAMDELNSEHAPKAYNRNKNNKNNINNSFRISAEEQLLESEFQHHHKKPESDVQGDTDEEVQGKGSAARARRERKKKIMKVHIKSPSDTIDTSNMIIR